VLMMVVVLLITSLSFPPPFSHSIYSASFGAIFSPFFILVLCTSYFSFSLRLFSQSGVHAWMVAVLVDNKSLSILPQSLATFLLSLLNSHSIFLVRLTVLFLAPFFILVLCHLRVIQLISGRTFSNLPLTTISSIISAHSLPCIDLLKVDVEGAVSYSLFCVCVSSLIFFCCFFFWNVLFLFDIYAPLTKLFPPFPSLY
jgi:hypothetical protein